MQQGFIVADDGGTQRRVPVGDSMTIGRAAHCSLVIHDSAASRQHLEVMRNGDGFVCRDLGSSNGTVVNGERIVSRELHHGDRIRVGETVLRFELAAEPVHSAPQQTVFMQTVHDPAGRVQQLPRGSASESFLEAAYSLMNSMASTFDPCLLVDTILQTTMKAIRAQRGAVLFAGPDEELLPCPVCGRVHTIRDGRPRPARVEDIQISETVARRVLQHGENVLFGAGIADEPIEPSHSMAALNLTSILCVPIRTQNRISGILYIDTNIADHQYTRDDALLAAAAGNSAGLALENARNHRALLDKQRIEQDIEAAWTIQEGFLVNDWPTDDARFEVFGLTRPARIVGGDFYDFVRIDENRVGMLIGDVSGKGVPAALTMAKLLAEFRLCTPGAGSPAEVLKRLNERLTSRSRRGLFCTVAALAVDLRTGRALGANAGHHPLLCVSKDGASTELEASGPPLGILEHGTWTDESLHIETGETVVFYTDGIVEAKAGVTLGGEEGPPDEYGLDNLLRVAGESARQGPHELIEAAIRDVDRFCSPAVAHDDCTLIALRYLGRG